MKWIIIFIAGFKTLTNTNRQNNPTSALWVLMNDLQYDNDNNNKKMFYEGLDHRYPIKECRDDQLELIHIYIQKMQILDILKNKTISEKQRELIAIDYLDKMKSSKYAPNIFSGGLLDEWNDI